MKTQKKAKSQKQKGKGKRKKDSQIMQKKNRASTSNPKWNLENKEVSPIHNTLLLFVVPAAEAATGWA